MMPRRWVDSIVGPGLVACAVAITAAQARALERMLDNGAVRPLAAEERSELGDPFFKLVLEKEPPPATVETVLQAIQSDPHRRKIFVVSEELASASKEGDPQRRAVIGFEGTAASMALKPNVMLSVTIGPNGFLAPDIEAWGWDSVLGRYNYYSRERESGSVRWFFHGSSADLAKPASERGRCLMCHPSGAPVMKELFFPWVNWHGPRFAASYLQASGAEHWPIADSPAFRESLAMADKLEEDFIVPSITRFNQSRLDQGVVKAGEDRRALRARELLAPLFRTTEFNLITSSVQSGMHPLANTIPGRPASPVRIPRSFFLNADLIGGNTAGGLTGLGLVEANAFGSGSELIVQPGEYEKLVHDSGQRLGSLGGDAAFAWLTPEPSFVDNQMVDLLLRDGAVTRQFVAAVLSVDLRNPIYSKAREDLLVFIPDSYSYRPADASAAASPSSNHALTKAVLAALNAQSDLSPSAQRFRDRLKDDNAVELLRADVAAYLAETVASMSSSDAGKRAKALDDLHEQVIARRRLAKERFPAIIESEFLLPLK